MKRNFSLSMATLCLACASLLFSAVSCEKPLKELTLGFDVDGDCTIRQGETLDLDFTIGEVGSAVVTVAAESSNSDFAVAASISETDPSKGTVSVTAPEYILSPADFTVTVTVNDAENSRTVTLSQNVSAVMVENFVEKSITANSFIVAPGSFVKFPAAYGAASTEAVSYASLSLVWQDCPGLVTALVAAPEQLSIYAKLGEGLSGNAVIAAKDAEGTVLWSWHLWVCDFDPAEKTMTYTESESGKSYTFMDRYLGATSSEAGSDKCHGNFYQWGRKDPFPGSTCEASLKTIYDFGGDALEIAIEPCAAENNIPNSIANPSLWFSGVSGGNYGWISNTRTFPATENVQDIWGGVSGVKSKYDPCPEGWMVPEIDAWKFYSDAQIDKTKVYSSAADPENPANKDLIGRSVEFDGSTFFFPAQGEVQHGGSYGNGVGTNWPCSKAWSSTADPENCRAYATSVSPSSTNYKGGLGFGYGLPVRCVKQK